MKWSQVEYVVRIANPSEAKIIVGTSFVLIDRQSTSGKLNF